MTNGAAIGYMILAAKSLKLDHEIIKELEAEMKDQMDFKSEEQAQKAYQSF